MGDLGGVQVIEFDKKAGLFGRSYALAVVIAPEDLGSLDTEFQAFEVALGEWVGRRSKPAISSS